MCLIEAFMQKSEHVLKKDGSSARPKITTLEKAIRELEKIVTECKFRKFFYPSFLILAVLEVSC